MNLTDLPIEFLYSEKIHLTQPDLRRAMEMHHLIVDFSDSHREFLAWANEPITFDNTKINMNISRDNFQYDKDEYKFLIIHNRTDKLVGCISLFIRQPQIPYFEIGYWISTNEMGHGFITQACMLVRDLACKHFKAKRLEIRMARKNLRSINVALRCGFHCEAILSNHRVNGVGHLDDTCIYIYQTQTE